jgi:disulfide bond formation protein DsbB
MIARLAPARQAGLAGAVLCAVAMGGAMFAEYGLHLIPCALCLLERWPFRIGIVVGLAAFVMPARFAVWLVWALVALCLADAAIAFVHVGVEQHWWKSPLPECTAPDFRGLSIAERLKRMSNTPAKSCADADYPIPFLPISIAQGVFLYASAAAAGLVVLLRRRQV